MCSFGIVCDCVWTERSKGNLCCHLSVRGDSGRRCRLAHSRQVCAPPADTEGCLFMHNCGQTQRTAQYFVKVNICPVGIADASFGVSPVATSYWNPLRNRGIIENILSSPSSSTHKVHFKGMFTPNLNGPTDQVCYSKVKNKTVPYIVKEFIWGDCCFAHKAPHTVQSCLNGFDVLPYFVTKVDDAKLYYLAAVWFPS